MYFLFNPALRSRLCFRSALAYLQISLFTFPFVSSTPSPSGAPPVSGGERMAVQFSVLIPLCGLESASARKSK